jgi:hypothetical protein
VRLDKRVVAVFTNLTHPRMESSGLDVFTRPTASGVHVSASRRIGLGLIGFSAPYKNDDRGVEPRPSTTHEEGTLNG